MKDEGRVSGPSEFGVLLRNYRLAAGLSQEALAERARMSSHGVSALERGYRRTPQRETLALLSSALALDDDQRRSLEVAATRVGLVRRAGSVRGGPWTMASLPIALTRFVGREAELDEITALVRDHRMVTLTGAGGVGKTQTALHVATALGGPTNGAICFIALAPIADPSLVVSAITSALGVRSVFDHPLLETLLAYLKNKTSVLILDNCEHVITQAASVSQALLADCPRVRILATSREPLRAAGEYTYRLPSLKIPSSTVGLSAADAAAYEAIALFCDRARAVDHRFTLTDENAPIVSDICRRLDGIPLAIELAAARVSMLTPRQLRERLDERFHLLAGGRRDALPRQQTLRALIDWSYDLLDVRERTLFRRLGVFVNGFMFDGAAAVGSDEGLDELDVFDVLSSLVDKSLVLAEPQVDGVRYRLLESTHAYAVAKLDDAGERDLVASRHLKYLRDHFAEVRAWRERTTGRPDLVAALQTELEDVRLALDGALDRSALIDGAELLANIDTSWRAVGLNVNGRVWCEAYLEALPASERRLRARLLIVLSHLLDASGHSLRALELATEVVEHAYADGDASLLARALHRYADAAISRGQLDEAERALARAEAIPGISVHVRNRMLGARAQLSQLRGQLEVAVRMYERLRKECRALGDTFGEQAAAGCLAETEHALGQTQRAAAIVRETLPEARGGTDKGMLAKLLQNLAGYLAATDDLPAAAAAASEAIEIHAAREPDHADIATAIEHLALVIALRANVARAAVLEGYADAAFERHGFSRKFTETATHDRLNALLREELAPDELVGLIAEGAALTPEAAIALASEESKST